MTSPEVDRMAGNRRRSPWLAVPLYLLGSVVLAADLWGVAFWARVGGQLGRIAVIVGVFVAVVLGAALILGARRRWSSRR
jgi:hypothetical protein